jgi:hypothetical protein
LTAVGAPPSVAVGYLRYGGGDKDSPYFVVPGFGREPPGHGKPFVVTHWWDGLGEGWTCPAWGSIPPHQPTEQKSNARLEWENQELRRMLALITDKTQHLANTARELAEKDFHRHDNEAEAVCPAATTRSS